MTSDQSDQEHTGKDRESEEHQKSPGSTTSFNMSLITTIPWRGSNASVTLCGLLAFWIDEWLRTYTTAQIKLSAITRAVYLLGGTEVGGSGSTVLPRFQSRRNLVTRDQQPGQGSQEVLYLYLLLNRVHVLRVPPSFDLLPPYVLQTLGTVNPTMLHSTSTFVCVGVCVCFLCSCLIVHPHPTTGEGSRF